MSPKRFNSRAPSFNIADVHCVANARAGSIATGAADTAAKLGYFNEDIWASLEALATEDFYKTDVWKNRPDQMVDVYYIQVGDHNVYLKFSLVTEDDGEIRLIVTSFKENFQP